MTQTAAWALLLLLAKATLVLLIAAGTARVLRRAAARHLVWSLALGALCVLPVLAFALPAWRLPWLRLTTLDTAADLSGAGAAGGAGALERMLLAAWAAGTLAVLARLVAGWWGIWRLRQAARPVAEASVLTELAALRRTAGVRGPVRLLWSETVAMPATWGAFRPSILLPAAAAAWSPERRRVVLLHELAHVARRDWATQTLATLGCALYWFHPGVWWSARRMRIEREEACDDRVLAAGAGAADYAGHLVDFARDYRRASTLAPSALAMARPSQLEARVRAVLDGGRDRRGVAFSAGVLLTAGVGLALLPLASAAPTEQVVSARAPRPLQLRPAAVAAGTERPNARPPAPAARPADRRAPAAVASPQAEPPSASPQEPAPEEQEMLAYEAGVLRSRSLAALIRATASPQTTVRRDAVRALSQIRDEAVVTPLARSMRDQDAGVRIMAARALGEMAVVRPRPAATRQAPESAAEPPAEAAAYALASRAAEALRGSLADEDPEVRDTALRALEEVGGALDGAAGAAALQPGVSTIVAPSH